MDNNKRKGLSNEEAAARLKTHGYNELPASGPKSIYIIALEVMKEPMFLLLISCALLYMALGDLREGLILLSTISIIIFITFYQSQKTEKALDALKRLSSPRALVLRNGAELRIPGREVVPGDLLILHEGDRVAADAHIVDSRALTIDESLITGESVPVLKSAGGHPGEELHSVFSGTLVVQGKALALVYATGLQSGFGKIGTSIKSIDPQVTRLQSEMKSLVKKLFIIGAVLSLIVSAAFYLTRGNLLEALLSGLAASMALLPEEFPVVLTVFLALGAWRLSRNKVLTRKPSSIETLGSATVLCSDKTGTITMNKIELASISLSGSLVEREQFAGDLSVRDMLFMAGNACSANSIDPIDKAILSACSQFGWSFANSDSPVKEYALTAEFAAITRVFREEISGVTMAYAKGAPERVLEMCQLTDAQRNAILHEVSALAASGYRLIALASGEVRVHPLPELQKDLPLEYRGLLVFEDPVRPEVPKAVEECRRAGIKIIMITGDYPETARSIARQIGMPDSCRVVSGDELNRMSEDELRSSIGSIDVFARAVPEMKLRIVQALQFNGEIVAMTGDGVNDAPALKAADIGIAMGAKGTDVAREAASLVLLDDNFSSIVAAIRSGRRIFDNLQKAMTYIMAIHIPIIGLTLLPAFFSVLPLFLLPLHIVFMELIIDPVCSIAFESEGEEKGIMDRRPRDPKEKFFGGKRIVRSVLEGILLLALVLLVYFFASGEGHSEEQLRTICFTSLITGNLALILTNLSKTRSFLYVLVEKNISVISILTGALVLLIAVISLPQLREIFSLELPELRWFLNVVLASGALLALLELMKLFQLRSGRV